MLSEDAHYGNKNTNIVVAGDICVNLLQCITYSQNNMGLNWQTHLNMHSTIRNGEALLISKLIALSTGASVLSPNLEKLPLEKKNEVYEMVKVWPEILVKNYVY